MIKHPVPSSLTLYLYDHKRPHRDLTDVDRQKKHLKPVALRLGLRSRSNYSHFGHKRADWNHCSHDCYWGRDRLGGNPKA